MLQDRRADLVVGDDTAWRGELWLSNAAE